MTVAHRPSTSSLGADVGVKKANHDAENIDAYAQSFWLAAGTFDHIGTEISRAQTFTPRLRCHTCDINSSSTFFVGK